MPRLGPGTTVELADHPEREGGEGAKNVPERIEALVSKYQVSYYELAKAMGVSRETVHAIRKRKREATEKFIRRLDIAEQRLATGRPIEKQSGGSQPLLLFAVNSESPPGVAWGAPEELIVELQPTEAVPKPQPVEMKLVKPTRAKGLQRVMDALRNNQCDELLLACLPDAHASQEFIEQMTMPSYLWALKKCVRLILGPEWHKDLQRAVDESERQAQIA